MGGRSTAPKAIGPGSMAGANPSTASILRPAARRWQASWRKLHKEICQQSVCRLLKSFHGRPMSGFHWDRHYSKALIDFSFQMILWWECLYFHPTLQVILSVYAADFELAGKKVSLAKASQIMRDEGLKLVSLEESKDFLAE